MERPYAQKRYTAQRHADKETQVNTISTNNNNDQQQQEIDLDAASSDENTVDAVVVSRHQKQKEPVAKDGVEKKATAAGHVKAPAHVNAFPVNSLEDQQLIYRDHFNSLAGLMEKTKSNNVVGKAFRNTDPPGHLIRLDLNRFNKRILRNEQQRP